MKPSIDIHTCTCTCTRIYYYTCMYYFDFTLYLLQSQYCMCIRFQFYLNLHTCNGVVLWSVQGCLAPYERKLVEVTFAPQFQQGGRGWEHREAPPTQRDYALFLKFILVDTHSSTSEGHTLTVIYTLLLIVLPYTCIHVHVYCTVEPLGNITFGTSYSVHYRRGFLYSEFPLTEVPLHVHVHTRIELAAGYAQCCVLCPQALVWRGPQTLWSWR